MSNSRSRLLVFSDPYWQSLFVFVSCFILFVVRLGSPTYLGQALDLDVEASGQLLIPSLNHPVWTAFVAFWSIFPNGAALFSAYCGALAIGFTFLVCFQFTHDRFDIERAWNTREGDRSLLFKFAPALIASLLLLFNAAFMKEALQPSLLTFHILILVVLMFLSQRLDEDSPAWLWSLFCFIYGLGLVEMVALWLVFPIVFLRLAVKLWGKARTFSFWANGILFLLLGLSAFFWRPIFYAAVHPDRLDLIGGFAEALKSQPLFLRYYLKSAPLYIWLVPALFCFGPLLTIVIRWQDSEGSILQSLFLPVLAALATVASGLYLSGFIQWKELQILFQSLPSQELLLFGSTIAFGYLLGFWIILTDGGLKSSFADSLIAKPVSVGTYFMGCIPVGLVIAAAVVQWPQVTFKTENELRVLVNDSILALPERSLLLLAPDSLAHSFLTSRELKEKSVVVLPLGQSKMNGVSQLFYKDHSALFSNKPKTSSTESLLEALKSEVSIWTNIDAPPLPSNRFKLENGRYLRRIRSSDSSRDDAAIKDWWKKLATDLPELSRNVSAEQTLLRAEISKGLNEYAVTRWLLKAPLSEVEELLMIARTIMPINLAVLANLELLHRDQHQDKTADEIRDARNKIIKQLKLNSDPNSWVARFGWLHTTDAMVRRLEVAIQAHQWPLAVQRLLEANAAGLPRTATGMLEMNLLLSTDNAPEAEVLGIALLKQTNPKAIAQKAALERSVARALILQKKSEEAGRYVAAAEKTDPTWEHNNLMWGQILLLQGKLKEAEARLAEYQKKHMQDVETAISLSEIRIQQGNFLEARKFLDAVAERGNDSLDWEFTHAKIDWKLGFPSQAKERLLRLKSKGIESAKVEELLQQVEK
jgi:hypothetical protein